MLLIFLVFVPASEYDSSAGLVESSVRIGAGTAREFGSELEQQGSLVEYVKDNTFPLVLTGIILRPLSALSRDVATSGRVI